MKKHINRWQKTRLEEALAERRVVLLSGARQCGKTTLARQLQTADVEYRTLDDQNFLQAALADPQSFVRHKGTTLIIDEIQRAPDLLPAIKIAVDQDTAPGQYLLTGSANINAIPTAKESLAGRVAKVRLRPLAEGEINGSTPDFLIHAFEGEFDDTVSEGNRDALLELGFRGGYPEAIEMSSRARTSWYRDYVSALLERDLQDIARVHRIDAMRKLVEVLAAWSSKYIDIANITSKLSIKRPTVEAYINALEALYIAERVPPWTKTDYQRVGTKDKLFMTDCGMMAAILNWQIDQIRFDVDRSGKLVETLAFNELKAHVDNSDIYKLYHYRDWEQREIDFLIERNTDGALLGVEVKASETIGKGDFKHLAWFRDNLASERSFKGTVIYSGTHTLSFGENLWAVPFGALW